jgi:hypothetical protein
MSSNTFGNSLLQPFNSSNGHTVPTVYGDMDLDWFTDIRQVTSGFSPDVAMLQYIAAKLVWTGFRYATGQGAANPLPFQDPGEQNAMKAIADGMNFEDLFDADFFNTYEPELPTRNPSC